MIEKSLNYIESKFIFICFNYIDIFKHNKNGTLLNITE